MQYDHQDRYHQEKIRYRQFLWSFSHIHYTIDQSRKGIPVVFPLADLMDLDALVWGLYFLQEKFSTNALLQKVLYYLHLLDPVAGAAHFEVSKNKAKKIIKEVQDELPGYMVPKLAQEIPGMPSKQTL